MVNQRQSLPTRFSEKKKDKNRGGDEDDNEGGDGENHWRRFGKYDMVTAGYTSANDAVHNAAGKRQGKREERRIKQGNRQCSGISIKKNIYVPPKSTSHHSRSSRFEDFSGGTDDNKNAGRGGDDGNNGSNDGDDDKKGSGGGDDGNNGEGGGSSGSNNKDKCSGGAGFGCYGREYHAKAVAYTSANDAVHNTRAKCQRKREERKIKQGNRECSGISIKKNTYVPPKSTSHHSRSSLFEDFSGSPDDNKNGGDDDNNGSDGGDDDKKGSGGGDNGNNGEGVGGSGSNNKDKCGGGAGFGRYGYRYHPKAVAYTSVNDAVHNVGAKCQRKREERRIKQGNRECSGISIIKNLYVPPKSISHHSRSSCFEDFSGGTDDHKNGGDDDKKGSGGGDDGNNGKGGGGGSGSNNKDQCSGGAGFGCYGYGYHDKVPSICLIQAVEKREHRKLNLRKRSSMRKNVIN